MIDVMSRLDEVKVKTADALRTAEADPGASVVLVAVVREFDKKADKSNANSATEAAARDSVIELEQAGDSAKAAVEADMGASEATRQAVQDAHLAICILKTEVVAGVERAVRPSASSALALSWRLERSGRCSLTVTLFTAPLRRS